MDRALWAIVRGVTETDLTEMTWCTHSHRHTQRSSFSLAFGSALREGCQAETSGVQPGSSFGSGAVSR